MKIKVSVPTDLSDIKLSQYQKLLRVTKDIEDNLWINRQTVGIMCNLSDDMVKGLKQKEFNSMLESCTKVLEMEGTFSPIIEHNGKEYGFIPNLDDITVGEKADIDLYINDWQKMDRVMAILYRPITYRKKDKYLIEEYTGKEEPLDVTMDVVKGAFVFFYRLMNDLLIFTQSFIRDQVLQPKTSQILEENGVGIKTFMHSLETTFSGLRQYLGSSSMRL